MPRTIVTLSALTSAAAAISASPAAADLQSPGAFPPEIVLGTLTSPAGVAIRPVSGMPFGRSYTAAMVGDMNGDGLAEIVLGASAADPGGRNDAGMAFIIHGSNAAGRTGALEPTAGFQIQGISAGDALGTFASPGGDINGDGYADVLVVAPDIPEPIWGHAYAVFGAPGVAPGGTLVVSALNGANGFRLNGNGYEAPVGGLVDFNADGFDDILVSRTNTVFSDEDHNDITGGMQVHLGPPSLPNSVMPSFIFPTDAGFGSMLGVAGVGDVNADGLGDFVAHQGLVVFGTTNLPRPGVDKFYLSQLDGAQGFRVGSQESPVQGAAPFSGAGDVNGDGIDDLVVSVFHKDALFTARAAVLFGRSNIGGDGVVELDDLDGTNGFVIQGFGPADTWGPVGIVGDVNGDGLADIALGIADPTDEGATGAGIVPIIFGATDLGASGVVELESLDGSNGFVMRGPVLGAGIGVSLGGGEDFNGDGVDDIVVGGHAHEASGGGIGPAAWVVFGRRARPAHQVCPADVDGNAFVDAADFVILASNFGASVTPDTAGDLNSDGLVNAADLVILAGDFGCAP